MSDFLPLYINYIGESRILIAPVPAGPFVNRQSSLTLPRSRLILSSSSVDLLGKESRRLVPGLRAVQEMRGQNRERAPADGVPGAALNARLLLREVGDAAVVLLVLGVPEEHRAGDLVLDRGVGLCQGVSHDGGALTFFCFVELGCGSWRDELGQGEPSARTCSRR